MLHALDYLLASFASSVTGCALHRDFTLPRTIILAVLDVRMRLTPYLTTMNVPVCANSFFLETRHDGATKTLPVTRLDLLGVVLGFLDAFNYAHHKHHRDAAHAGNFGDCMSVRVRFVYAHHKHRLDSANAGSFGYCLTGRVRFMTAITPAYAHAYQTICLAMHTPGVPRHSLRLPKPKSRYPFLPNDRSIIREEVMTIVGGLFIQMVVLASFMVKSLLDGV